MTVSIKDIARTDGVSHSTVPRWLSDSPLVSTQTKTRIQRPARDMGYSPDAQARSRVVGRTLAVGAVVDHQRCPLRHRYSALQSMCDEQLGRVLDPMSEMDIWRDTEPIGCAGHGFL